MLAFNQAFMWIYPKPGLSFLADYDDGILNEPYMSGVPVEGGVPPFFFHISSGELPPGLVLDPNTADITGMPLQPRLYLFMLTVFDSDFQPAEYTQEFQIFVWE